MMCAKNSRNMFKFVKVIHERLWVFFRSGHDENVVQTATHQIAGGTIFAVNYSQFECVHLFENIFIILSEPQCFPTHICLL